MLGIKRRVKSSATPHDMLRISGVKGERGVQNQELLFSLLGELKTL